jgi:hypothetical protein
MSLALGVAVTGLMISTAAPASADDTTTTFVLAGGALSFSVAPSATLTGGDTGTTTITGSLGPVSVTDNRGGVSSWIATATSTPFTGIGGSSSTAVSYTAGTVNETGTITVADGTATTLTATAANVVAPTTVSGNNTASWAPTLNVSMPTSALADTYTGTVTTSVA